MTEFTLTPRLVVRGAARALDFYCEAFGARIIEKYADEKRDNAIVHSALDIGGTIIAVIDEVVEWGNLSPDHLGGTPILLHTDVEDPDAVAKKMVAGGAEIVVPIADQFYGRREGRVRDPFGHLWILGKELETIDPEEIQRRVNAFGKNDT